MSVASDPSSAGTHSALTNLLADIYFALGVTHKPLMNALAITLVGVGIAIGLWKKRLVRIRTPEYAVFVTSIPLLWALNQDLLILLVPFYVLALPLLLVTTQSVRCVMIAGLGVVYCTFVIVNVLCCIK